MAGQINASQGPKACWNTEDDGMQYDWPAIKSAAQQAGIDPEDFCNWVFDGVTEDATADELVAAFRSQQTALADSRVSTLQMIQYNNTGEVRVIDTDLMIASDFLHHADQDTPLEDYELDFALEPSDLAEGTYRVIREAR